MAFYDWNRNGKKDIVDDYIEYNIYKESMKRREDSNDLSYQGDGISSLGAFISVIGGLVIQAIIYTSFGVDVEKVPCLLIVVLWVGFSALTAFVCEWLGI